MSESQNIEYKESWKDEYLKWICGFANAQGGTLYIGINDSGEVVGVRNINKLLEDIPNKIQSGLGVACEVNKHTKNRKDYLEIIVNSSTYPISYHGEFHYRCGSTKQQLTGIALSEFIMRKTGVRWEDAVVEEVTVDDLDDESFKIFRREALRKKRMTEAELNVSNEELLQKLHLMKDGKLKRSAVLLFYHDPAIVQVGSFVKVGKFNERGLVVYHNDLEESLIVNAHKVVDLIFQMYLKAKISYDHDIRVEDYPFAREAIREAIYNAIAHNCYMYGTPIQIRIEERAIIISNSCILSDGWTVDTLMEPHNSKPYNPDIANVFYRAGFIENWGQGIQKICDECEKIGADKPVYELIGTTLRVHFPALESAIIDASNEVVHQDFEIYGAREAENGAREAE
ncbi:MAG: putative DNA binding domain-containing protein, partial [Oscillospiraceae bacterium]|nr:putative DNA binding domain-containing protein [Oscillospiraceae bacterium]